MSHNTTSNTNCDVTYTFNYDSLGRKTEVKVGQQLLSRNVYENDRSGMLKEVQYGNGGKVGYEYDEYDRLTGVKYDGEATPRYTYEYGANGQAMRVEDKNLNRVQQVEYDLAERPMQKTIRDLNTEELIYRTTLQYDGKNRLKDFSEQTAKGSHRTSYTYDKDDRTTAIQYDDAEHKVEYTYDALNRITARKVTNGTNVYETKYGYVAGSTTKYGAGATTPLIASITQGADANAMNFGYTYDSRGNITSETRNGKKTTYSYDALGQLIRVNDPHENATWVYNYDRGGNITSKVKYAYTTGTLGTAQQTIPYTYGDANWKDKLTAYNGKTITYDAIGNPLNDGERKYTWSAGRQLKKIALPATVSESMNTTDGVDTGSNARLKIVFSNSNVLQNASVKTTASAHVYIGTKEITSDIPAANFTWVKVAENGTVTSNWKKGVKSISLAQSDLSGATEIRCEVTRTSEYGTVQVDNSMMASHTPAVDDANDRFSIENGNLMLNTTDTENLYIIEDNCLKVEAGLGVNLTAKAVVYPKLPDKVVEFKYNADGLRTQKKVILPNGKSTITEYILHGKLITEMRKGQDVLHFFYDEQSRPATIKYNGKIYTYVHNLQGDIVGILDSASNLVVEYGYDAWGRSFYIRTLTTEYETLAGLNPFRYRGYVWNEETGLYYLKTRYFNPEIERFINNDVFCGGVGKLLSSNGFAYCNNRTTISADDEGTAGYLSIFAHSDHAWIVYEDENGVATSYGTWGYADGIWETGLNIDHETALINKEDAYKGRVSLTAKLTDEQEKNLMDFINKNQGWKLLDNCASFAAKAWEAAGQQKLKYKRFWIPFPSALARSIRQVENHRVDAEWNGINAGKVGKKATSSSSNISTPSFSSSESSHISSLNSSGITFSGKSVRSSYRFNSY